MHRRSIALVVLCLGALFAMPALAQADTGEIIEPQDETAEAGFQAGTCYENREGEAAPGAFCSVDTPDLFYKAAAGHPPVAFTQYIIRHSEADGGPFGTLKPLEEPYQERSIKTLHIDVPPGLTVNPEGTPKCSVANFEAIGEIPGSGGQFGHVPNCPKDTAVGHEEVTLVVNTANAVPAPPPAPAGTFLPRGFVIPPDPNRGTLVNVYNLEPKAGEPALFGFVIGFSKVIFLETEVAWESDFHESFTIKPPAPTPGVSTLKSRLVNFGSAVFGASAEFAHQLLFEVNVEIAFVRKLIGRRGLLGGGLYRLARVETHDPGQFRERIIVGDVVVIGCSQLGSVCHYCSRTRTHSDAMDVA